MTAPNLAVDPEEVAAMSLAFWEAIYQIEVESPAHAGRLEPIAQWLEGLTEHRHEDMPWLHDHALCRRVKDAVHAALSRPANKTGLAQ